MLTYAYRKIKAPEYFKAYKWIICPVERIIFLNDDAEENGIIFVRRS